MRKAFTLIELMAVVSLMALLGTISVVAWGTVTRDRADRSARASLQSFVRSAAGAVEADGVKVVLRFRSHVLEKDDANDEEKVCRAVAVRPAGWVSKITEGCPWDEFADEGPVRLDTDPQILPLSGDVGEWKIGQPYGRAFSILELPSGYCVDDGDVPIAPSEYGKATLYGSIVLKALRPDGSCEQVGGSITIDFAKTDGKGP